MKSSRSATKEARGTDPLVVGVRLESLFDFLEKPAIKRDNTMVNTAKDAASFLAKGSPVSGRSRSATKKNGM